jgi:4-hydroxy-tetrahydrodipicolinate synthase
MLLGKGNAMKLDCRGIIVPMLTPFRDNGDLDEGSLRKLTNFLIEKGMHILFPAGSTGEGWALTREERKRVFEIVIEESRGRAPVYAGTGAISTREAIYLTQMAEDCGADAAVLITPFYIAPTGEELYEHYAAIAKATSLPLFPYNNPNRTGGVNLSAEVIVRLSSIGNVVGIKDSSGNLALTRQYVEQTPPHFAVCQGQDAVFFPSFVIGCCAAVAATANVAPDLVSEIYAAFTAGDYERSQRAQSHIAALRRALSLGTFPAVLKEAMVMLGMPMGPARAPVTSLSKDAVHKLRQVLESMGVLPG